MKGIVVRQYGGPEVLKFEDYPDPVAGPGEVLVRVAAASVNPIDYKRRAGLMNDYYPIPFPGLMGADFSGTVLTLGPGVANFRPGDPVFGMAPDTYAELCVVKATSLASVPAGLDLIDAAALPLVTTTGNLLISEGAAVTAGQTVLVVGAAGSVGRSAVFTAKQRGAVVIAGIRKSQIGDAADIGADRAVATDDAAELEKLPPLDAVADTVDGKLAEALIAKVKPGGIFASVLGAPQNAGKFPAVKVVAIYAKPHPKILQFMAEAVADGKLRIPISGKFPLRDAAAAQAAAEKGSSGKTLIVV